MFKTLSTGVILGVLAAGAAAQFMPLVDLHREASIVTVRPNGGNTELFRVNLSTDRLVAGGRDLPNPTPAGLVWPEAAGLAGTEMELFKVRNTDNRVIGVASRVSGAAPRASAAVEWTIYLPARGAMYVTLPAAADGGRVGPLRAGTREFSARRGSISEQYVPGVGADAEGQIELRATLVSTVSEEAEEAAP